MPYRAVPSENPRGKPDKNAAETNRLIGRWKCVDSNSHEPAPGASNTMSRMVTPLEPRRSPRVAERRRTLLHSREEPISEKNTDEPRQTSRAEAAALRRADGLRCVI